MRWRLVGLIVLFCVDRAVKNVVWFKDASGSGDFFLTPTLNRDISFSVPVPEAMAPLVVPVLALIILFLLQQTVAHYRRAHAAFFWWGLVAAGAVSNVLDRITLGGVFDYIDLGWWPVFNISDVYITAGVAVVILGEVMKKDREQDTSIK